MTDNVHSKFLDLIKKGALGTISEAECTLKFECFVPVGVISSPDSIQKSADIFYELIMKGSHPTMNPVMDKLMLYETTDLKLAIKRYIEEHKKISTTECDSENDVMTIRFEACLLTINCLPFFDQEEMVIENASVQTALFKYKIGESIDKK